MRIGEGFDSSVCTLDAENREGYLTGNGTPAPRCIHANRNERKVFSVKVETKCLMGVRVLQYPLVLTKEPKSHVDTE